MSELDKIMPQRVNANRHTERGMRTLEASIQQDGTIGAITVAANLETFDGSARLEKYAATGLANPIFVRSDGSRPIVHIREDIPTADDPRAVRLGLAANRVAQLNLEWEPGVLAEIAAEQGTELLDGLWSDDEQINTFELAGSEVIERAAPDAFSEYGDDIATDYCCPKCGYGWSGKPK